MSIKMSKRSENEIEVKITVAGDGFNYPTKGCTVTVHYTGYVSSGKKFDSSRDRGKPLRFTLGAEQVIPGLDDGVSQLSIGERANIYIPAKFAYGEKGFPGLIPPNENLMFDLELLDFTN